MLIVSATLSHDDVCRLPRQKTTHDGKQAYTPPHSVHLRTEPPGMTASPSGMHFLSPSDAVERGVLHRATPYKRDESYYLDGIVILVRPQCGYQ